MDANNKFKLINDVSFLKNNVDAKDELKRMILKDLSSDMLDVCSVMRDRMIYQYGYLDSSTNITFAVEKAIDKILDHCKTKEIIDICENKYCFLSSEIQRIEQEYLTINKPKKSIFIWYKRQK